MPTCTFSIRCPPEDLNQLNLFAKNYNVKILHATYGEMQEDGRLKITEGNSYVLLVIWDKDGDVHSLSVHQFGSATIGKGSPHYADQAPLLSQRRLKPVWFEGADIRQHIEREYVPGEE